MKEIDLEEVLLDWGLAELPEEIRKGHVHDPNYCFVGMRIAELGVTSAEAARTKLEPVERRLVRSFLLSHRSPFLTYIIKAPTRWVEVELSVSTLGKVNLLGVNWDCCNGASPEVISEMVRLDERQEMQALKYDDSVVRGRPILLTNSKDLKNGPIA